MVDFLSLVPWQMLICNSQLSLPSLPPRLIGALSCDAMQQCMKAWGVPLRLQKPGPSIWLQAQGLLEQCPASCKCVGFQRCCWLLAWRFMRLHFFHQSKIARMVLVCQSPFAGGGHWSCLRMPANLCRPSQRQAASAGSADCLQQQHVLWLPPRPSSNELRRLSSAFFRPDAWADRRQCAAWSLLARCQHGPGNLYFAGGWSNHGGKDPSAGCLHMVATCMKGPDCEFTTTSMFVSSPSTCCGLSRRDASIQLTIWWQS